MPAQFDLDAYVVVLPPHEPPRPHQDQIRQCQACNRRAMELADAQGALHPAGWIEELVPEQFDGLIPWFRAVLDFEEKQAKAASDGPWGEAPTYRGVTGHPVAIFIAYHDPASTLRKIAGYRRLLDGTEYTASLDPHAAVAYLWTIAVVAEPYDIFPGYRKEWRP